MALTPIRAQATVVDARPRNGSATSLTAAAPCSRMQYPGRRDGKVAGWGRSFSRLWMVS